MISSDSEEETEQAAPAPSNPFAMLGSENEPEEEAQAQATVQEEKEEAEPAADEQGFECERDCGFTGCHAAVRAHEAACSFMIGAGGGQQG